MSRLNLALPLVAVIGLGGLLASLEACGSGSSGSSSPPPDFSRIKHVIVIVQENRTPDNLFHDPVLISRGVDIASTGVTSTGQTIALTPVSLGIPYDFGHAHDSFLIGWNNGSMDGFDQDGVYCPEGQPNCAPADAQYQYVQASDVQPYFTLAETYTFGDRMFQTNQGPSFPAHQYLISGTSAVCAPGGTCPSGTTSVYDVAEVPVNAGDTSGCIAAPDSYVLLIDTTNPNPNTNETQTAYPCFDHPTLTDLLDAQGINWKYYTPTAGSIWTGPVGIEHMCGPNNPPPNGTECVAPEWTNHVVIPETTVLNDISAGQLAPVSWVIPRGQNSDHPAYGENNGGPSWVASIVNAIGTSQYWADTAILITWDDWGGWYDHVPPEQIYNSYEYGFRVPLIVVSPYVKAAYTSHVVHDFGSILKFIETVFNLPTVDPAAGYADSRADNLADCFDFNQAPLTFQPIPAPLDARYFLNDKSPPLPPDDD